MKVLFPCLIKYGLLKRGAGSLVLESISNAVSHHDMILLRMLASLSHRLYLSARVKHVVKTAANVTALNAKQYSQIASLNHRLRLSVRVKNAVKTAANEKPQDFQIGTTSFRICCKWHEINQTISIAIITGPLLAECNIQN